jgi:outer membrane protein assembly factor BamA
MSEASQERTAKSLANIDRHMQQLVKILEKMNENLVIVGQQFQNWLEIEDDDLQENKGQLSLLPKPEEVTNMGDKEDAAKIHELVKEINDQQRESGQQTTVTQPKEGE